MENTLKPKRERETWRDWQPLDESDSELSDLITRDELLDRLKAEGFVVSRNDLRNWQSAGAIPYGVNRWHEGATRTLYHPWVLDAIRTLRTLQSDGRKMADIRQKLRTTYRVNTAKTHGSSSAGIKIPAPANPRIRNLTVTAYSLPSELRSELRSVLDEVAHIVEHSLGRSIVRTEVRLIDENDHPLVLRFDVTPLPDA